MNYRTNNFPSYYDNNPKLGYSNVSKGFGQSYRSKLVYMQTKMKTITLQNLSLCCKMSVKNSRKQRIS